MRQGPNTSTGMRASPTSTPAATQTTSSSSTGGCGCGCHDQAATECSCCKLHCFERPQYFCGQLLSDAELTLQQTYFREKSKLYHRTMDGFGVVCGFQMYCDARCKGHIRIADGYAIDPCGNDLVVCEPRTFDVIGALRRKKWLVEVPGDRPRSDNGAAFRLHSEDENGDDCIDKQCFYIGICYSEEPIDFATPYTTECDAAPGPCQPTRIREGVRFEIYDTMPVRPNPLDSIGKRIEHCFRMFREGQFSKSLASNAPRILDILCRPQDSGRQPSGRGTPGQPAPDQAQARQNPAALFREMQAQFLHELHTCPDRYNCDLEREVYRLRPPDLDSREGASGELESFTRLFELIQKYVFSCVLSQLAFSCPEPQQDCCVLIGSVEVTNGCLTRVINYPRWYLWCFGNFFEVLLYTIANDAARTAAAPVTPPTRGAPDPKPTNTGCGPEYEIDLCQFLNLFSADHRAFEKAARSSVDALQASYRALVEGFNFMRPGGIAPSVLRNLDRDAAENLASMFGLQLEPSTGQQPVRPDVFAALADNTLHFRSQTLVYDTDESPDASGNAVTQVSGVIGAPAFAVGPYTHSMMTDLMERLTNTENRLRQCEARLGTRRQDTPPSTPENSPSTSETPASGSGPQNPGPPQRGTVK
ncbi:MAG: hypothetical protein JO340_03660 [Acidobacteriaceae bacterium]|nr:hypothetical protein [Acidobacteriaceae bacterium]